MDWILWLFLQAIKLIGLGAVTIGAIVLIARLAQWADWYLQFDVAAHWLSRLACGLKFVGMVLPVSFLLLMVVAALWWWAFF